MMKAIQLVSKESVPKIVEVDMPNVEQAYRNVKVLNAALNHRDLWIAKGQYAKIQYPIIPGSDLCGTLDGKRVFVNPGFFWGHKEEIQSSEFEILGLPKNGSFAEYVAVPEDYIYEVPDHLSNVQAAALPLAGVTAYRALFSKCRPKSGERILITGIGGGVALQVLQFAVAYGLEVYVSSSDDKKIQKAVDLGAKGGINYTKENWEKEFVSSYGNMNMIIDSAAGSSFQKLLTVAQAAARICIYGGTQGPISHISPQIIFWKQLTILGTTMGSSSEFGLMLDFVAKHKIIPIVDSIYGMNEIKAAFTRMEEKEQFGKIVLQISE